MSRAPWRSSPASSARRRVLGWFGDAWPARCGFLGALAGVLLGRSRTTPARPAGRWARSTWPPSGFFWASSPVSGPRARNTTGSHRATPSHYHACSANRPRHALLVDVSGGRQSPRRGAGRRSSSRAATSSRTRALGPTRPAHRLLHRADPEERERPGYLRPLGRTMAFGMNGSVSNNSPFPGVAAALRRELRRVRPRRRPRARADPPASSAGTRARTRGAPVVAHLPRLLDQGLPEPHRATSPAPAASSTS